MTNKKLLLLACAFTGIVLLLFVLYFYQKPLFSVTLIDFKQGTVEHPADIIEFNNSFWVTELLSSKVVNTDFEFSEVLQSLSHPNHKKQFSSPHHFATDNNTLYFSAGWGSTIYSYDQSLTSFKELPENHRLNAPHGICRQDNWLYIADSLNSRLLRINVDAPTQIETFSDKDKHIAYGRQIICTKDNIWISNSYEKKEGLNPGVGSNVLKISDFNSGKSEIVTTYLDTNITGIYLHNNRFLITAKWHANSITIYDTKTRKTLKKSIELPSPYAGVPYGMFFSKTTNKLYIAFIGDIYGKKNKGGIAVYNIEDRHFLNIF